MKIYRPDTPGYDDHRTGFQLLHPHHPDTLIAATTTHDIRDTVQDALTHRTPIAVQASGHGHATPLTSGTLIDTSALTDVHIDPHARTATIDAGATWQHVIDAAAPHGLAPRSGSSPGVGAISYTLGGGIGLLARPHGYAADHVHHLDVITLDGHTRHVDPTSEPDLYWAQRGGGGNYGIVTSITIDLLPITHIHGGGLYYDLTTNPDILDRWRHWTTTVPDTMTSAVSTLPFPDLPMVPTELRGRHITQIQLSSTTPADDLIAPLRALHPIRDTVREVPYPESATVFDEPTQPHAYRSISLLLDDLDPDTLPALRDLTSPDAPTMTVANIRHLGGALTHQPDTPNAVPHRDAAYSLTILSPVDDETAVRELHEQAIKPWTDHTIGRSANFSYGPVDTTTIYPPDTHRRLTDIAHRHDPHSLLAANHPLT